ncbi:MAG: hypothetical protein LQ337_006954 [Flavoplaca oasis]|nr:MAG: hypothetical protein LQ337_006954 [Flavoplaca oasis]
MDQKKSTNNGQAQLSKPRSTSDTSASFTSRVGASASALAKETFVHPDPGTVVNELSSAEGGKSGSFSSPAGPSAMSTSLQSSTASVPSSSQAGSSRLAHHSFRSQMPLERTQSVKDDFDSFLSPQNQVQPDSGQPGAWLQPVPLLQPVDSDGSSSKGDIGTIGSMPADNSKSHLPNGHPEDGLAVVAMLSNPSFCIDEGSDFTIAPEAIGFDSRHQEKHTNDLCQRISGGRSPAVNPLDLIPDFHEHPRNFDNSRNELSWAEQRKDLGETTILPSRSDRDFEVGPWIEILDTYHDEVWGDMLPLVKEARKEAHAIRNGETTHDEVFPAIRRLSMIAGHMQSKG